MKKYKFKLEPVLKIRKVKEEQCKMEIGRIQVQIRTIKAEIEKHREGINQSYETSEKELKKGLFGQELRFHPYFVSGKNAHINRLQRELENLDVEIKAKYEELSHLRANVKVIEKMKEKDKIKYKKQLDKKIFEEIEEQTQNWRQFKK